MVIDTSGWSGEGEFTASVLEALKAVPEVDCIRVEDAPASRAESGYNFLSNEIYVRFASRRRTERARWWRLGLRMPGDEEPALSMTGLSAALARTGVGDADYADEGLLQYLRTERIIPPYQTRGTKHVELVRIYEIKPGGLGRRRMANARGG